MKTGTKALFILSITWLIVSLLWFLWIRNNVVGIIWFCLGIAELVGAIIRKNRHKYIQLTKRRLFEQQLHSFASLFLTSALINIFNHIKRFLLSKQSISV